MAWYEWPLILSSVFSQLAIGAFLVLAGVIFSGKLCFGQSDRLHRTMPALWLMLFSALFLREVTLILAAVGYKPSTEALMVIGFFALALVYWFAEKSLVGSDKFRKLLLAAAFVAGVAYLVHGLLLRNADWLVASHFIATTLCGGTLLAHASLVRAEHKVEEANKYLPLLGCFIGIVCLITGVPQLGDLAARYESAGELGPFVSQVVSLGLMIAAIGVWWMPALTKSKPALNVMTFALVLMFASSYFAAVGY
ncbi:dimethyl sulfoxide reductase [Photobacterium aquae]|uniref:Dimethyl sulfoxide reductase n=1 Tax=Photobacterium aquae TaxID=1195763 RepID=A0A0J1GUJ2_9GAMM|nr:DmsC/YnfH family molybdoenzyme membrane anchor subunit [Photobacterium aquae]KLV03400.1 dimethyl sulfoxide reductase [Photobacterium aquae]